MILCGLLLVQQAAIGNCLSFDPFPFNQNGLASPEVDGGGRQVADALMISQMIIVGDEGVERLRELLNYDPETGIFTRRIARKGYPAGIRAGHRSKFNGYRKVSIDGCDYPEHRLAWLYITGRWPMVDIDHINRVKDDNRFCNLRETTRSQNRMNTTARADNKHGFKGVWFHKRLNKWQTRIMVNGKSCHLGYHGTPRAASTVYRAAARLAFGQYAPVARRPHRRSSKAKHPPEDGGGATPQQALHMVGLILPPKAA
jgi:HNH endonuclease/AP2 domain